MRITKQRLRRIIRKVIKEESKRTPEEISTMRTKSFGETAGKVLKNFSGLSIKDGKKINFSYDGDYKDKEYFYHKGYNSSKLGKYGKVGDPYTYELVNKKQNKYRVVSGPKKSPMGKIIKIGGEASGDEQSDYRCALESPESVYKEAKKLLMQLRKELKDEQSTHPSSKSLFLKSGLTKDKNDEDSKTFSGLIETAKEFEEKMKEMLDVLDRNFSKIRVIEDNETPTEKPSFEIIDTDNLYCRFVLIKTFYYTTALAFSHPAVNERDKSNRIVGLQDVFNLGKFRVSQWNTMGKEGVNRIQLYNFFLKVNKRLKTNDTPQTFWNIKDEKEAVTLEDIQADIAFLRGR